MTVAQFDIAGAPLKETLAIVASNHKTVSHWMVANDVLIFFWSDPKLMGAIPLPGPMMIVDCDGFIKSALTTMEYGSEPNCDGHCAKSWRIRDRLPNTHLGVYVAFVVTPHWNEYHK